MPLTLFAKNDADATTTCLTISRAAAGKKDISSERVLSRVSPWCTPVATGVVEEDISNLIFFEYNDGASLEDAEKKAGADLRNNPDHIPSRCSKRSRIAKKDATSTER